MGSEAIDTWKAAGAFPFQALPTMTVDGETYAESSAILHYAGKLSGLYPKCDKSAMKVDMTVDALETVVLGILNDYSKESREKVLKEVVPRCIGAIDKMYAEKNGP